MQAVLKTDYICECGFVMWTGTKHTTAICMNQQCPHFEQEYSLPTVTLALNQTHKQSEVEREPNVYRNE